MYSTDQTAKKFSLSNGVNVPNTFTHRRIENSHLFIASDKSTWIVTNDIGAFLLAPLSEGYSIQEAIELAVGELGLSSEQAYDEMHEFLVEIETKGFYGDIEVKVDDDVYSSIRLHLYLTHACNLSCAHCYMDAGKAMDEELNTEEWIHVIDVFTQIHGRDSINLSGGEPLCRKDLVKIATHAKKLGHYVVLLTNGTLINQKLALRLAKNVDRVQISLDGASQSVMDAIRGKGTFNKVLKAINLLKHYEVGVDIAVGVFPRNIDDLSQNLIPLLDSIGYSKINVRLDDNIKKEGRALNLSPEMILLSVTSKTTLTELSRKLRKAGWTNSISTLHVRSKNCGIGKIPTVDSNGDIYPCPIITHFPIGNVRKDDLRSVFCRTFTMDYETQIDHMKTCPSCELKYICSGGCRIENFRSHKDYLIPACDIEYKQKVYNRMLEA